MPFIPQTSEKRDRTLPRFGLALQGIPYKLRNYIKNIDTTSPQFVACMSQSLR